jgi:hypothetical protein
MLVSQIRCVSHIDERTSARSSARRRQKHDVLLLLPPPPLRRAKAAPPGPVSPSAGAHASARHWAPPY